MTERTAASVKAGLWMLIALPGLVSAWLVYRYGVNVPFWDEWTIAHLLQRFDDGTLTVGALFAQHNEHRMFVPRAIQLLAALTVGWDTRAGMWLTQALIICTLAGCVTLWRRTMAGQFPSWALVSLAMVALILFSPAQHQNLFWGFQLSFYIPAACLLASTLLASSPTIGLGTVLTGIAFLCTAATLTLLPGLLTWPLAAAAVMLARGRPRRATALKWCAWSLCCALVVGSYSLGYETPAGTPSVRSALSDPIAMLVGAAACIGGFLAVGPEPLKLATLTGITLTAVWSSLLAMVWRRRSDDSLVGGAAPWIVMSAFGLLTAVAIALGRVGYGYVAMLESRYTSLTAWTLIGVVMIAATLRVRSGTLSTVRMWSAVCVATLAVSAVGFPHHLATIRRVYSERLQSLAIYNFAEVAPRGLPMLPPWLDWPTYRKELFVIEQSGWRKARPVEPTWVVDDQLAAHCEFGEVEFLLATSPRILAGGWAYLPRLERPADAVIVTTEPSRRIIAVQPPLIGRGDIGDRFNNDGALVTGWTLESRVSSPGETTAFWALDVTTLRAYPLCQPK